MKQFKDKIIIGIDHDYGNIKTTNHIFKTGVLEYDAEPLFTNNYRINVRFDLRKERERDAADLLDWSKYLWSFVSGYGICCALQQQTERP